jgi:hypothetical protein
VLREEGNVIVFAMGSILYLFALHPSTEFLSCLRLMRLVPPSSNSFVGLVVVEDKTALGHHI